MITSATAALWRCGHDPTGYAAPRSIQPFTCAEIDRDRYGRTVATCEVAGQDIGAAMVRSGWALDYARYSSVAYGAEPLEAEQARRGLWSGSFVPPWE